MSLVDCIRQFTVDNDLVPYYAGPGDNDHDGTPDRADFNDGNGVDCSGWVWAAYGHCGVNFPLSSSAGYAFMAKDRGWILPREGDAQPGDMVIYDKYGDAFASNGPRGHVGILVQKEGTTWLTSESRGGQGVGLYPRQWNFWVMAIRIPQKPDITAEQLAALIAELKRIDNARKDEPSMPKQINYGGHSHVFDIEPDVSGTAGKLRQYNWTGTEWDKHYPTDLANKPGVLFALDQSLDVKTKEAGQSENPIDVYGRGKLGEWVHCWWTGTRWGCEVNPA